MRINQQEDVRSADKNLVREVRLEEEEEGIYKPETLASASDDCKQWKI